MKLDYEFANRLQVEVICAAFVELDETWRCEGTCDPFTRLYFVQSGEGYLRVDGQEITLKPGYMYLVPAGCQLEYGCTHLTKLFFHLMLTSVDGLDLLSAVPCVCKLPISEGAINDLIRWCNADEYLDLVQLKMFLYQKIGECLRMNHVPPIPVRKHSALVVRAIDYIRDNIHVKLCTAEIAQALFVSESKLRKEFREETGMPLGKYIDNLIMLKAKQMLTEKALTIGQVSQRLGFCDQFYFSRRFKENFHQTPSEYRAEIF